MPSSDHLSCGKYPLNCHFESFVPCVNLFRDFIIRTGNIWNVNRWNLQAFKGDFVQTTFIFIDSFFNNFLSLDVIVFKIFVISKLSSAGEILNSMTSSAISSFKLSTTFSEASLSVPISSGISSLSEATSGVYLVECCEQLSSTMISSGISSSKWLSSLLVTSELTNLLRSNTRTNRNTNNTNNSVGMYERLRYVYDNYICVD